MQRHLSGRLRWCDKIWLILSVRETTGKRISDEALQNVSMRSENLISCFAAGWSGRMAAFGHAFRHCSFSPSGAWQVCVRFQPVSMAFESAISRCTPTLACFRLEHFLIFGRDTAAWQHTAGDYSGMCERSLCVCESVAIEIYEKENLSRHTDRQADSGFLIIELRLHQIMPWIWKQIACNFSQTTNESKAEGRGQAIKVTTPLKMQLRTLKFWHSFFCSIFCLKEPCGVRQCSFQMIISNARTQMRLDAKIECGAALARTRLAFSRNQNEEFALYLDFFVCWEVCARW